MQTKQYSILLEAASPICHSEGSFGNTSVVMRRKVRCQDGTWANVPCITGDTLRHGLREAAAYAFLDAAGLLDKEQLTMGALRLLFNGGMVTGRGDASVVSLDKFREMSTLCPPLALLGGCADNRVIPGRVQVGDAMLVCEETAHTFPEWVREHLDGQQIDGARSHLEEVQRVRMDPALDPGKRALLTEGEQIEVTGKLTAGERAHEKNDAIERDEAKSTMMPRRFERVAQGSLFMWSMTATCYTELDVDTLHVMLGAFLGRAVVGGKKGTGHGQLRPAAARDIKIARPSREVESVDVTALGERVGSLFFKHVGEHKEQIATWLQGVDA